MSYGIRIPKRRGYTVIPNGLLPEGEVSARAWGGVYAYLLSRPEGWVIHVRQLQTIFTEGRDAIYTAMKQLREAGLLEMESYQEPGQPPKKRYVMVNVEELLQKPPNTDSQDTGNQDRKSRALTTTDITTTEFTQDIYTSEQSSEPSVSPALSKRGRHDRQNSKKRAEESDPISPEFYHSTDRQILLQNVQSIAQAQIDHGVGSQQSDDMMATFQNNLEIAFGSDCMDELDGMIYDYAWIPKRTHVNKKHAAIWLNQLLHEWSNTSGGVEWRGEHVDYVD